MKRGFNPPCAMPKAALILLCIFLSSAVLVEAKPSKVDVSTVPYLDLPKYMGRWYIISHVPNRAEKGKVGTSDSYEKRADGRIDVIFSYRKKSLTAPEKHEKAVARVVNPGTHAQWRVKQSWLSTEDYAVLELDPEYRWSVVAASGGKLVWVLSRTPSLDDKDYSEAMQRLTQRGIDPGKMEKVPQTMEQK